MRVWCRAERVVQEKKKHCFIWESTHSHHTASQAAQKAKSIGLLLAQSPWKLEVAFLFLIGQIWFFSIWG